MLLGVRGDTHGGIAVGRSNLTEEGESGCAGSPPPLFLFERGETYSSRGRKDKSYRREGEGLIREHKPESGARGVAQGHSHSCFLLSGVTNMVVLFVVGGGAS